MSLVKRQRLLIYIKQQSTLKVTLHVRFKRSVAIKIQTGNNFWPLANRSSMIKAQILGSVLSISQIWNPTVTFCIDAGNCLPPKSYLIMQDHTVLVVCVDAPKRKINFCQIPMLRFVMMLVADSHQNHI
jgi:hypothetical protein